MDESCLIHRRHPFFWPNGLAHLSPRSCSPPPLIGVVHSLASCLPPKHIARPPVAAVPVLCRPRGVILDFDLILFIFKAPFSLFLYNMAEFRSKGGAAGIKKDTLTKLLVQEDIDSEEVIALLSEETYQGMKLSTGQTLMLQKWVSTLSRAESTNQTTLALRGRWGKDHS